MNNEFGAPVPVTLNGKEYRFSPLSLEDIEELDNWVRAQYMNRVMKALPVDAPKADREMAIRIAQSTCVNLTWLSGQGASLIASHKGAMKIAQLAISKRHPEMTDEKFIEILKVDKEAIGKITAALKESSGSFRKGPATETGPSNPPQA